MGYSTEFTGVLKLDKKLDIDAYNLLKGLSQTRRMARNVEGYGVEGEFYAPNKLWGNDFFEDEELDNLLHNYNTPPVSQPGLWCDFEPTEDGMGIQWNGKEKTYHGAEWIHYICTHILEPAGYTLNGTMKAQGEERDDQWSIIVENNNVTTKTP